MKGVIYARYSSENQREESIDGQIRECTAFAKRAGITILGTYIDRALSAKTDNRPDFQRMIKDSSKNMFDTIVVWKLDRFARNRYDSAYYKHLLKKNNVKVISATEAISQGAEGIILESVLEGMAEYYSAELSEKVTRGMTENALKCKYNGGTLPIGYRINKEKQYEIDPLTAPIIFEVFTLYKNGKTMNDIVTFMNEKGIRNQIGGKISLNSVSRLLRNRHYIGEYRFKDIVKPGGVPAIVPIDLFNAVQDRLKINKKCAGRFKAKEEYFLSSKIFCGDCHSSMIGECGKSQNSKFYHYYKCSNAKRIKECKRKPIRKDWIEDIVFEHAKKVLEDDEYISNLISAVIEESKKENTILPVLKKDLSDVEKSIKNMLNAIQDGIYTPSTKQRLEELERRREQIEVQISMEELSRSQINEDMLRIWFDKMKNIDNNSPDYKHIFFHLFVNSVIVRDNGIEIMLNYKEGTKIIPLEQMNNFFNIRSDVSPPARPKSSFNICWDCFFLCI